MAECSYNERVNDDLSVIFYRGCGGNTRKQIAVLSLTCHLGQGGASLQYSCHDNCKRDNARKQVSPSRQTYGSKGLQQHGNAALEAAVDQHL